MKKIIFAIIFALLVFNQILYITKIQYICTSKINSNKDLNYYEIVSALQTHSMFWLIGWIVEPNTAQMCFCKQFHISNPIWLFSIPEDYKVRQAKEKRTKVRLTWTKYTSKASIYLNGSYIEPYDKTGLKVIYMKYILIINLALLIFAALILVKQYLITWKIKTS